MLVKKVNPEWFPSENKELKVGESVDITDPKQLIVNGDVIGLAEDGITELSAYELYGVLVKSEAQEFEEFIRMKKAQATQATLQAEQAKLKAEVKTVTSVEEPKVEEVAVVTPVEVIEPVTVEPVTKKK